MWLEHDGVLSDCVCKKTEGGRIMKRFFNALERAIIDVSTFLACATCWVAGWMETGTPMGGLAYLVERLGRLDPNGAGLESVLGKLAQAFIHLAHGETWVYLVAITVCLKLLWDYSKGGPMKQRTIMIKQVAELNKCLSNGWNRFKASPLVAKAKAAWGRVKNLGRAKVITQ